MTYEAILKDLKGKKFKPLYLLYGEEPYYIDLLTDYFEHHVLDESERAFNLTILYGKDVDFKQVVDEASRFPMMAPYQVVILKEAQSMKDLLELEAYAENPASTTLLVICYKHGKLDGRTRLAKLLSDKAVIFESKPVYDRKMPAWIADFLKKKGFQVAPRECELMAEYMGNNLGKVANELNKMALNLPSGHEINQEDIETYIGISKDYNIFELQDALTDRNIEKIYRILHYFQSNVKENPLIKVVAMLFGFFSKVYLMHFLRNAPDREVQKSLGLNTPFFVRNYRKAAQTFNLRATEQIIHLLRTYDLKSKGVERVNFTDESLMQELIYLILKAR